MVDWIEVELRQTPEGPVRGHMAGILLNDGSVVDSNGQDYLAFTGVAPGSYYVTTNHRNHLPASTAQPVLLGTSESPGTYDFIASNANESNDLDEVEPGVFALVGGDANQDGCVTYIGAERDQATIIEILGTTNLADEQTGYVNADMNLNGKITYIGATRDQLIIINSLGTTNLADMRCVSD
jgi:hypothetical protein